MSIYLWSKRHWLKLLLFGSIFGALLICCTPDVTWASLDYDLFDFLYSSTYLNVGHASGFPLYTMLGWLVTRLPGNPAWSLAFFLSVIPTMVTCGLIFWIVRRKTVNHWAPYLATLTFAGSQVIFSQAIIPEIYALTTMFMVASYALLELDRKGWALLVLGFGCAVHYLAVIMIPIVMWRYRVIWRFGKARPLLALIPGLLLYLYIPVANSAPHMSLGPNSLGNWVDYFFGYEGFAFSIPIWWMPQRIGEGIVVIGASFGLALLFITLGFWRKQDGRTLFWLAAPGLVYYLTTLGPMAYVHMAPAFAFGAVAAGLALDHLPRRVHFAKLARVAMVICVGLLAANAWTYDIGRTLDPEPTGARQFLNKLDELEDGTVLVCWDATAFAGVYYYNEQNGRSLVPVHPVFVDPEKAYEHELARFDGLDYSIGSYLKFPPPSEDWLVDFNDWCLTHTIGFANNNPDVEIVALLSDTEDRTRRNIRFVDVYPTSLVTRPTPTPVQLCSPY